MPMGIVTDTCPAPECNLTQQDIEQFLDEMTSYVELFEPAFQRSEQLKWSKVYLHGLLGDAPRKNIEQMALGLEENVRGMQHYIGQSTWKQEPVITIHQDLVAETLGETDGVALIDESGVVKQGDDSVGVAAQYCCSVGKVANSQIGVYLGYASRKGYSLVVVTQPACACVIRRIILSARANWLHRSPKRVGPEPPSKKAEKARSSATLLFCASSNRAAICQARKSG